MIPFQVIERKRDGGQLSAEEFGAFLHGYLEEEVPDYQMAALLMAILFRGLVPDELGTLVETMLRSGAVLELDHLPGPRVDKHSTGGVGDKVSLVLAPLAAELGIFVPMMSGRGLGHTGGTLDKLEAIPGFRTDLPLDRFLAILQAERFAMTGQTPEIAPLDLRLYDLRSVTGTVASIPLIAASIMSKKLAEGLTGLVLDVKVGRGAFISSEEGARELAHTMVGIGTGRGVVTSALLTAMDRPLGRAAGNALEVREALECLRGEGPPDLREATLELAAEMLRVAGLETDVGAGKERAGEVLDGGAPLERFARVTALQGGDPRVIRNLELLPSAPERVPVQATRDGWVQGVDPRRIGFAVVELGGGRTRLGQEVDPSVGFVVAVRPGDRVTAGDLLGEVHARSPGDARMGRQALLEAVELGEQEPGDSPPLIRERIGAEGDGGGTR